MIINDLILINYILLSFLYTLFHEFKYFLKLYKFFKLIIANFGILGIIII